MKTHRISRRVRGFTLIELMITVAIVAVLAGIALPAYQGQVRKSRRADAITAISQVMQAQERWRSNNATYNSAITGSGSLGLTLSSTYYTFSLETPSGQSASSAYSVLASAVSGKSQASDSGCQYLKAVVIGGNIEYQAGTSSSTSSGTVANRCWSR